MNQPTYIQWANENASRAYPVAETASQQADDGSLLPQDILVDLGLLLTPGYSGVRLASLTVSPALISLSISSDQGALFCGTYLVSEVTPWGAYPLVSLVPNCSGWVSFGTHQAAGQESYRFSTAQQSLIEGRTTRVIQPPGVTSLQREGAAPGFLAQGLVRLEVGGGIQATKGAGNTIVLSLDAVHQPIYALPCSVQANQACQVPVIRRISNVKPDSSGKITLRFA